MDVLCVLQLLGYNLGQYSVQPFNVIFSWADKYYCFTWLTRNMFIKCLSTRSTCTRTTGITDEILNVVCVKGVTMCNYCMHYL